MAIVPTVILSVPGQKELFLVNVEYAAFDCRGSLYGEQRHDCFSLFSSYFPAQLFHHRRQLPLHKGNCTCRAGWQTISQTITIIISQKRCFAVYHADCTLVTSFGTRTTSVTFSSSIWIILRIILYHPFSCLSGHSIL